MRKFLLGFTVCSISFYSFMFLGFVSQRINIEDLESKVGNQRVELRQKDKTIEELQNEVIALNKKVDELPK